MTKMTVITPINSLYMVKSNHSNSLIWPGCFIKFSEFTISIICVFVLCAYVFIWYVKVDKFKTEISVQFYSAKFVGFSFVVASIVYVFTLLHLNSTFDYTNYLTWFGENMCCDRIHNGMNTTTLARTHTHI